MVTNLSKSYKTAEERRAKIVCTWGPATDSAKGLAALLDAGMDVARLNFSHGTHAGHAARLKLLRRLASERGKTLAVLQDLQGPKIRTGALEGGHPVELRPGSTVTLTTRRLPGIALKISALTAKDRADLKFGLKYGVDYVALSFVRRPEDVLELKKLLIRAGKKIEVVAKLEKPEAIDRLEDILLVSDAVMVARGDLGVELPPESVPVIQKRVIERANAMKVPVITATQMLESMTVHPRPTRAEASDVANAIFDGTDAVMLSAETASGQYPIEAVGMMARIVIEAESHMGDFMQPRRRREHTGLSISETICESVAHAAEDVDMAAIAVFTDTGNTARMISKYRPRTTIYAFSRAKVCNRMNLLWGVHPVCWEQNLSVEGMVETAEQDLVRSGKLKPGDIVGVVAGTQMSTGSTNFMRLHVVNGRG